MLLSISSTSAPQSQEQIATLMMDNVPLRTVSGHFSSPPGGTEGCVDQFDNHVHPISAEREEDNLKYRLH